MKKILAFIVFFIFLVHSFFDLERVLFINEIFSILGLYFFVIHIKNNFILIDSSKYNNPLFYLFLFIFYLFIRVVFSLPNVIESGAYAFLRTTSLFYSVFTFFLAFYLVKYVSFIFSKYSALLSILSIFSVERMAIGLPLVLLKISNQRKAFVFIVLCFLFHFILFELLTQLATLLIIVIFFFYFYRKKLSINPKYFNSLFIVVFFVVLFLFWFLLQDSYMNFVNKGYEFFGEDIDGNSYWRFMYWFNLLNQVTNEYFLFGKGFGTKLFEISDPSLWWLLATQKSHENEIIEYVLGPHNSFVIIIFRTGIIGVFIFLLFLIRILYLILKLKIYRITILSAFLFVNVSLFFNVVLESPMLSVNYWFVMGVICRLTFYNLTISK